MNAQSSILPPAPQVARYLTFDLLPGITPASVVAALQSLEVDDAFLVGIGEPLVAYVGSNLEGLRTFPALSGPGVGIPSTQCALWCWLRGEDRGELLYRGRAISQTLGKSFRAVEIIDGFKYGDGEDGLDLTGYEDGTENPSGTDAVDTAIVSGRGTGLDGSSFVAVQRWAHDLDTFTAMPEREQDHIIGRRKSNNEEIEDAPESSHVKRTAQDSFTPEALVLRRSMSWAEGFKEGTIIVAFAETLDAFEAQLRRMAGLEDGITDAVLRFSRPLTGGYYWCPPIRDGRLDLTAIGEA